jgi:hypothetical protein
MVANVDMLDRKQMAAEASAKGFWEATEEEGLVTMDGS